MLPGQGFTSALAQPSEDPYLTQLVPQGTLLSSYSPLQASALASEAALLSGHGSPQLSWLAAPGCRAEAGSSCPPDSPAGLTATDSYLHEVVAQITATDDYRKGGLIVLAFAAGAQSTGGAAGAGTPAPGTPTETPTGATPLVGTTLAATPQGVLLLSPFLRNHGRSATTFHPTTPRKDLEGLFHA